MEDVADDRVPVPLGSSRDRQRVDMWALVLSAEGLKNRVMPTPEGFVLLVTRHDAERARGILVTWAQENRKQPDPPESKLPEIGHPAEIAVAYAVALSILLFYALTEGTPDAARYLEFGSANASRIVRGEWWRVVTALCLHRDAMHVIGNALIGGLFLAALTHRTGPGLALLGAIVSGALGNLANALYYGTRHDSIGASTAVFGVVGLLSGLEAWRRHRLAIPWRGPWVPLGSGLAMLAMLGAGGGRVDFGAHVFGLLSGIGIGLAAAPIIRVQRPGPAAQFAGFVASFALLAAAWTRALA